MRALLPVLTVAACAAPSDPLDGLTLVEADRPDLPIPGLSDSWRDRFDRGDVLFEQPFRDATGLGPLYVRASCAACHADDGRGPGVVEKLAVVGDDGVTPVANEDALLPWGHTVRRQRASGATSPIDAPDVDGVWLTTRAPNAVFGRGYLEAVDDAVVRDLAAAQALRTDGISGRVASVVWAGHGNPGETLHSYGPGDDGLLGRFGHKARVSTLDAFVADALLGDMSITSPILPDELPNPDGLTDDDRPGVDVDLDTVNDLAAYVRLLDLPPRERVPGGEARFRQVGCDLCHTPTLRTRSDHPVPQLADVDADLYTDLLLHDLGPDMADGQTDAGAASTEWRTAPLIGLRFLPSLLHDGRAETVAEAIAAHGGVGSEAVTVVANFNALSDEDRTMLVRFVEAL